MEGSDPAGPGGAGRPSCRQMTILGMFERLASWRRSCAGVPLSRPSNNSLKLTRRAGPYGSGLGPPARATIKGSCPLPPGSLARGRWAAPGWLIDERGTPSLTTLIAPCHSSASSPGDGRSSAWPPGSSPAVSWPFSTPAASSRSGTHSSHLISLHRRLPTRRRTSCACSLPMVPHAASTGLH
jgi:hypothetical protein